MTIKKKITKAQYCDILDIKKPHFLWNFVFDFFIIEKEMSKSFFVVAKIKKYFYPILFIINLIAQFFYSLWDGGLKNIDISLPKTFDNYISYTSLAYKRMMQYL